MTEVSQSAAATLPRLLVVGCGRVFRRHHLPALRRVAGCRVVGIADPDAGNRSLARRALGGVPTCADLSDLLARVAADAALISTSRESQATLVETALEHGLHVLVEKPLAIEAADARRLAALAASRGRLLQPGCTRRLCPGFAALRAQMREAGTGPWQLRITLQTSGGQWERIGAQEEDALFDELLFDLGPDLVDLAVWLAGSAVMAVRTKPGRRDAHGARLEAELALADGSRAYARIGHGRRHLERIIARNPTALLVATPRSMRRGSWGATATVADRLRRLLDLAGGRSGLRPSLEVRCFARRLALFLEGIGDGRPIGGVADGLEAAGAAGAVWAWRRSLAAAGAWCTTSESRQGSAAACRASA